jgi:hypothetical protein
MIRYQHIAGNNFLKVPKSCLPNDDHLMILLGLGTLPSENREVKNQRRKRERALPVTFKSIPLYFAILSLSLSLFFLSSIGLLKV